MKNNRTNTFIFLLFVFIACSCSEKNEKVIVINRNNFLRQMEENSKILFEEKFTINSIGDTQLNYRKEYYVSGRIKTYRHYNNGIEDSIAFNFFDNGNFAAIYNRFNGRPMGKQVEYYPTGDIKKIVLSSWEDSTYFQFKCSEEGNITLLKGTPLHIHINKLLFHKGELFNIDLLAVNEKDFKSNIRLRLINPDEKVVLDTIPKFTKPYNDDIFNIRGSFSKVGMYKFYFDIIFSNEDKILLKETRLDSVRVID